jgi:hypothetical protein
MLGLRPEGLDFGVRWRQLRGCERVAGLLSCVRAGQRVVRGRRGGSDRDSVCYRRGGNQPSCQHACKMLASWH